jgi:hypothetical protein
MTAWAGNAARSTRCAERMLWYTDWTKRLLQYLRDYLNKEHRDKKKTDFDFTGWEDHFDDVRAYTFPLPLSYLHLP